MSSSFFSQDLSFLLLLVSSQETASLGTIQIKLTSSPTRRSATVGTALKNGINMTLHQIAAVVMMLTLDAQVAHLCGDFCLTRTSLIPN